MITLLTLLSCGPKSSEAVEPTVTPEPIELDVAVGETTTEYALQTCDEQILDSAQLIDDLDSLGLLETLKPVFEAQLPATTTIFDSFVEEYANKQYHTPYNGFHSSCVDTGSVPARLKPRLEKREDEIECHWYMGTYHKILKWRNDNNESFEGNLGKTVGGEGVLESRERINAEARVLLQKIVAYEEVLGVGIALHKRSIEKGKKKPTLDELKAYIEAVENVKEEVALIDTQATTVFYTTRPASPYFVDEVSVNQDPAYLENLSVGPIAKNIDEDWVLLSGDVEHEFDETAFDETTIFGTQTTNTVTRVSYEHGNGEPTTVVTKYFNVLDGDVNSIAVLIEHHEFDVLDGVYKPVLEGHPHITLTDVGGNGLLVEPGQEADSFCITTATGEEECAVILMDYSCIDSVLSHGFQSGDTYWDEFTTTQRDYVALSGMLQLNVMRWYGTELQVVRNELTSATKGMDIEMRTARVQYDGYLDLPGTSQYKPTGRESNDQYLREITEQAEYLRKRFSEEVRRAANEAGNNALIPQ
jgi:hypothetical protein